MLDALCNSTESTPWTSVLPVSPGYLWYVLTTSLMRCCRASELLMTSLPRNCTGHRKAVQELVASGCICMVLRSFSTRISHLGTFTDTLDDHRAAYLVNKVDLRIISCRQISHRFCALIVAEIVAMQTRRDKETQAGKDGAHLRQHLHGLQDPSLWRSDGLVQWL